MPHNRSGTILPRGFPRSFAIAAAINSPPRQAVVSATPSPLSCPLPRLPTVHHGHEIARPQATQAQSLLAGANPALNLDPAPTPAAFITPPMTRAARPVRFRPPPPPAQAHARIQPRPAHAPTASNLNLDQAPHAHRHSRHSPPCPRPPRQIRHHPRPTVSERSPTSTRLHARPTPTTMKTRRVARPAQSGATLAPTATSLDLAQARWNPSTPSRRSR